MIVSGSYVTFTTSPTSASYLAETEKEGIAVPKEAKNFTQNIIK